MDMDNDERIKNLVSEKHRLENKLVSLFHSFIYSWTLCASFLLIFEWPWMMKYRNEVAIFHQFLTCFRTTWTVRSCHLSCVPRKGLFRCHTKRRISGQVPANPSFGMTPPRNLKDADYNLVVIPSFGMTTTNIFKDEFFFAVFASFVIYTPRIVHADRHLSLKFPYWHLFLEQTAWQQT